MKAASNRINFTKAALDNLPLPAAGERVTYHDEGGRKSVRGLQLRVTSTGTKTFYVFQRVNGKPERVKVGAYAMGIEQAREGALQLIAAMAAGDSPSAAKKAEKAQSLTLAAAMQYFTEHKRVKEGKLPLKQRTIDDYLDMLKAPKLTAAGKKTKGGALAKLANKSIYTLTADDIRAVHAENLKLHSRRQAFYAMQTLKAVLRYHGVVLADSPFARDIAEAKRIYIEPANVSEAEPVKDLLEHLGTFWKAVQALPDSPVKDYIAFLAYTGCRPGEPLKVLAGDLVKGTIKLRDTKNRLDHDLLLSTQAHAIAQRNATGKAPTDRLFAVTPAMANALAHELANTTHLVFVPKMLRSLFASMADDLVSASVLKRLMNHRKRNEVTDANYIRKLNAAMREGWQKVADHLDGSVPAGNVVPISNAR